MKNINLIINGETVNVTVQRYFKLADQAYVIYSVDEEDADGNVKIFVAKVKGNEQVLPIETQEEWDSVKNAIIGIVNDNKECNKLQVEDLNYQLLENLEITDTRALRLPLAVMPYLSANIPEFNTIDLNEQEKALEEKTESLKEMNADLTNLMNEVDQEFAKVDVPANEEAEKITEEPVKKDQMEATMEIIMPSKPFGEEVEEKHKKKKNKFSLKHLFGKKDREEHIEKDSQPMSEKKEHEENLVEKVENNDNGILHETELPDPVALDPIVVDEIPVVENLQDKIEEIDNTPISYEMSSSNVQESAELPNEMSTEFNFSNVIMPEEKNVSIASCEIPEVVLPELAMDEKEEPMEILEVDDDVNYKKLYEEEKKNKESLQEKNEKLEELIKAYHEKLMQIRDIVR